MYKYEYNDSGQCYTFDLGFGKGREIDTRYYDEKKIIIKET